MPHVGIATLVQGRGGGGGHMQMYNDMCTPSLNPCQLYSACTDPMTGFGVGHLCKDRNGC